MDSHETVSGECRIVKMEDGSEMPFIVTAGCDVRSGWLSNGEPVILMSFQVSGGECRLMMPAAAVSEFSDASATMAMRIIAMEGPTEGTA